MKNYEEENIRCSSIAVTAGWNMSQNENEVWLSDLALSNVEALAGGEGMMECYGGGCRSSPWFDCYLYWGGYPSGFCPDAYGG